MSDLTFVQGDTQSSVYGTLKDADGQVIDLTGASVRFQMRPVTSYAYVVDDDAQVTSTSDGQVRYDWQDGDLYLPGDYLARWKITFADTSVQHSEPENTITVDPA